MPKTNDAPEREAPMPPRDGLDNLILQQRGQSQIKKLLLAAATLLLVLIIIVLVTKSILEPDTPKKSSMILPPEPAVGVEKSAPKEPLFEEVPIEEEQNGDEKIQQVIHKLKTESQHEAAKPAPAAKPAKPQTVASAQPAAKPQPKPEPKPKATPKPKPKPKPAAKPAKPVAQGSYYIQVGAFFRTGPDKRFLQTIKKEGLSYTIVDGVKNGVPYKKVLVGPYRSRAQAAKALAPIKKRINQNAYITRK
jgi:DedD protein